MDEIKAYVKEYLIAYRPEVYSVLESFTDEEWATLYNQIIKRKQHD
jgi:hypothetical protein